MGAYASPLPPTAPDVAIQQMPNPGMFAQSGQQAPPQGLEFVKSTLSELAAKLTSIAKIVAVSRPELLEPLKAMATAGSMIMSELESTGAPSEPGMMPSADQPKEMPLGA